MTGSQPRSKVARLIEQYDLNGMGEDLERKWTRETDRASLRDLAEEFNRRLLQSAMDVADPELLDGEIENLYRLLTDDDVTSGVRQQARNRVAVHGVDVTQLESEFVSYQAIRTYLTEYRDASPPDTTPTADEQVRGKRETIDRLESRLERVATRSLSALRNADHLTLGQFNVVVSVRVHCSDCNTQLPVSTLLSDGGCGCPS